MIRLPTFASLAEVLADLAEQLEDGRDTAMIFALKAAQRSVISVSPAQGRRMRRSIQALEAMRAASFADRLLA